MNPRSLAKTLPGSRACLSAVLKGYARKANIAFEGYAYMNIVIRPDSEVRGVLIPLSEEELALFAEREEGYTATDVTSLIVNADESVIVFIAPDIPCALPVPRSYLLTCTSGMTPEDREAWIRETELIAIEEDAENPVYEFAAE